MCNTANEAIAQANRPVVHIPIRTGRGPNNREHYMARHRRTKAEREATAWAIRMQRPEKPALPCVILLTRESPSIGRLDDDNVRGSLKAIRDEIAAWLGVDDRHSDVVRYEYAQAKAKEWGVRVEVVR